MPQSIPSAARNHNQARQELGLLPSLCSLARKLNLASVHASAMKLHGHEYPLPAWATRWICRTLTPRWRFGLCALQRSQHRGSDGAFCCGVAAMTMVLPWSFQVEVVAKRRPNGSLTNSQGVIRLSAMLSPPPLLSWLMNTPGAATLRCPKVRPRPAASSHP